MYKYLVQYSITKYISTQKRFILMDWRNIQGLFEEDFFSFVV